MDSPTARTHDLPAESQHRHPHGLSSTPDIDRFLARNSRSTARAGASDLAAAVPCVWNSSRTFACRQIRDSSINTNTNTNMENYHRRDGIPDVPCATFPSISRAVEMGKQFCKMRYHRHDLVRDMRSGNDRRAFPEAKPQTGLRIQK